MVLSYLSFGKIKLWENCTENNDNDTYLFEQRDLVFIVGFI